MRGAHVLLNCKYRIKIRKTRGFSLIFPKNVMLHPPAGILKPVLSPGHAMTKRRASPMRLGVGGNALSSDFLVSLP